MLLSRVRFFLVFSISGVSLKWVSVLVVGRCLSVIKVLLMLIIMLVRCDSGVRLLDVFIEFWYGIIGMMLCWRNVFSKVRVCGWMFDVFCVRLVSFSVIIRCIMGVGIGLLMLAVCESMMLCWRVFRLLCLMCMLVSLLKLVLMLYIGLFLVMIVVMVWVLCSMVLVEVGFRCICVLLWIVCYCVSVMVLGCRVRVVFMKFLDIIEVRWICCVLCVCVVG